MEIHDNFDKIHSLKIDFYQIPVNCEFSSLKTF